MGNFSADWRGARAGDFFYICSAESGLLLKMTFIYIFKSAYICYVDGVKAAFHAD
jgi:hypothetical protein